MSEMTTTKVAGRLSLDILPAEQSLERLELRFEQAGARMAALTQSSGQNMLAVMESNGVKRQEITALQEAKIAELQRDGELKRLMAEMSFEKQMEQSSAEHALRMELIQAEGQKAIETLILTSQLKIMSDLQAGEAKTEALLQQAALKRQQLSERIFQQQESHEQRLLNMRQLYAQRESKMAEAAITRQPNTMDKIHYNALLEDAERANKAKMAVDKEYVSWWETSLREMEALDKAHHSALVEHESRSVRDRIAIEKEYTKWWSTALSEIDALDKAHYTALLENNTRSARERQSNEKEYSTWWTTSLKEREAMDKAHYLALQEDRQRYVSWWKNSLSETEAAERKSVEARTTIERDYDKWWSSSLKEREAMDKLYYQATTENARRDRQLKDEMIAGELRQIKSFYDMKMETAQGALARLEILLAEEAVYFADNEERKLQAMRMASQMRTAIQNQEVSMDKLHYQALRENSERERVQKQQDIDFEMRQIKAFYDMKLLTANQALAQIRGLMARETDFFMVNQEKRIAAMRTEYQIKNDLANRSMIGNGGLSGIVGSATQFAAGMAIWKVIEGLEKIPHTIMDISASMTKLKQVLELSDSIKGANELNDALGQLHKIAETQAVLYGRDVAEVLDVMSQAGRRFKDVPSIIVATDNALQAMVADNVDAEKAIKGEEAMMAQFGLTLAETRDAWAKLTVASHVFLTDASGIIDAIERSGSSFAGMKVNTDGAIAAIVALAQQSGRTGAVVGNTWKSLMATLGTAKGIDALKELGIDAKATNGELENGIDILSQLMKKWPELSEAARTSFGLVLSGGKYQANQLLAFLNDTSGTFTKALNEMKKASVETQEDLVKSALESLPNQAKMTSAQLQVMAESFSNVATPAMISFFAGIREGSAWIGQHADSIEKLMGIGLQLAEAYVAWRIGVKLYTAAVESSTVATLASAAANARLNLSFGMLIAQRVGVVAGLQAIGSSMAGVASAAAVTAARIGTLVAVVGLFNAIAERKADPLQAKEDDLNQQLEMLQKAKSDAAAGNNVWGGVKAGVNVFTGWISSGLDAANLDGSLEKAKAAMNGGNYDEQIYKTMRQLEQVQAEKKNRNNEALDSYQEMIKEMLTKANATATPHEQLGNGDLNIEPGSDKEPSAADFARPYKNAIAMMEQELAPYLAINKQLGTVLDQLKVRQENYADTLKYGASDMGLMSQATQIYQQRLTGLNSQQEALHATNDEIRQQEAAIRAQLQSLNPSGAAVTSLSQGQQEAIESLSNELEQLTQKEQENSKQWNQAIRDKIQATQDWLDSLYQLQENGMKPLERAMKGIENAIKTDKAQLSLADNQIKHGNASPDVLITYGEKYKAILQDIADKQDKLHEEADRHRSDINQLTYTLNTLDPATDGYAAAVASLTSKIDEHKDSVAGLGEQWVQAQVDAQGYTDSIMTLIEDSLKTGYDTEHKREGRNLDDAYEKDKRAYDEMIKLREKNKDAIDAEIKALQDKWKAEDDLQKLTDLRTQRDNLMGQRDHEIIGVDGKLTYTYDVEKVGDLNKQISEEEKKQARDAQLQKLNDQKDAMEREIKDLQDLSDKRRQTYEDDKKALDDYWTYRLGQDQLKQEADRLVIKEGYGKALVDAEQFKNDMNRVYSQIDMASVLRGGDIASKNGTPNMSTAGSKASYPTLPGGLQGPVLPKTLTEQTFTPPSLSIPDVVLPNFRELAATLQPANNVTHVTVQSVQVDGVHFPNVQTPDQANGVGTEFLRGIMQSAHTIITAGGGSSP